MLALVDRALVDDLSKVDRVLEQVEQTPALEGNAAAMRSARALLDLCDDTFGAQPLDYRSRPSGILFRNRL